MIRFVSSVKLIAAVLMSAMLLMGMSCGAGGFSIPFADPVEHALAEADTGSGSRDNLKQTAIPAEAGLGKQAVPPETR